MAQPFTLSPAIAGETRPAVITTAMAVMAGRHRQDDNHARLRQDGRRA
jgi:hypothetical protein